MDRHGGQKQGPAIFVFSDGTAKETARRLGAVLEGILGLVPAQIQLRAIHELNSFLDNHCAAFEGQVASCAAKDTARSAVIVLLSPYCMGNAAGVLKPRHEPHSGAAVFPILMWGAQRTSVVASLSSEPAVNGHNPSELEDLVGRVAAAIGCVQPIRVAPHRRRLRTLASEMAFAPNVLRSPFRRVWRSFGFAAAAIATVAIAFIGWRWLVAGESDVSMFGFEHNTAGWACAPSGGCVEVERSAALARRGDHSLAVSVRLAAGSAARHKAVVMAKLPVAPATFADRTQGTVSAWARAPVAAVGQRERPNGFRLFVQDTGMRRHYGGWVNIPPEEDWIELTLRLGAAEPADHVDDGFIASAVDSVGVAIELGTGSVASFEGKVYLDSVDLIHRLN